MSSKTISASTLGLRFMQNAQRAKQLKEAEVERAHVKDDAEWEVDHKIRQAWEASGSSSSQTVIHEASYLPFLFPSLAESSEAPQAPDELPKGRRAFNKRGEEIVQANEPEPVIESREEDKQGFSGAKKSRVHPRPISISASSGTLSGFPPLAKKNTKTAKEAVYDNTGVGLDLRARAVTKDAVFLKPSGVDEPPAAKASNGEAAFTDTPVSMPDSETTVISGARSKKAKRERTDQPDGDGTKRKRKKKREGLS